MNFIEQWNEKFNGIHKLLESRRRFFLVLKSTEPSLLRSVEYHLLEIFSLNVLYVLLCVRIACLFDKQFRAPIELIKQLIKI